MKDDRFKVYTNPNIQKKKKEQEVTFELEIPDEETITGLFVASPYFAICMMSQEYFYYPVDLEAEETMMAPLLNREVFRDFVEKTKAIRAAEGIPLAALIHIEVDDDGEPGMESIFDGLLQFEFTKYFHSAVMLLNQEIMEEDFMEIIGSLIEELADNGYLDRVLECLCEYMSDSEVLEEMLFPEEEEEF